MFYIRADANSEIGSGHLMRCMSIAKALRKRGEDTTFITADRNGEAILQKNNFQMICLNSDWKDLDNEIEELESLLIAKKINKILIDSYFISDYYFKHIKKYTKVIYLDDLNKFIYPIDILINYNIYSDKIIDRKSYLRLKTKLLIGCEYAPLRDEFMNKRIVLSDQVNNILITTGGSDPYNVARNLLQSLDPNRYKIINFHIVIGKFNQNKEYMEDYAKNYTNITLHRDVTKMSDLMVNCDLAITAGGSTLYELCSCALPSISFSFADNQLYGVREFHQRDIIFYAGDVRENDKNCLRNIKKRMEELLGNPLLRKVLSDRMRDLVDGQGAARIANEIILEK